MASALSTLSWSVRWDTFGRIVRAQNYHQIITSGSQQPCTKLVPVERCFYQDQTDIQRWCGEGGRVSERWCPLPANLWHGWEPWEKESLNSLVFIKLGINIMAMRPAKTTQRTQLTLGESSSSQAPFLPCHKEASAAASSNQYETGWQAGEQLLIDKYKHSEIFQSRAIHTYSKGYSANLSCCHTSA